MLIETEVDSVPVGVNQKYHISGTGPDQVLIRAGTSNPPVPAPQQRQDSGQLQCEGSPTEAPGLVAVPVANIDAAPIDALSSDDLDSVTVRWFPPGCVWTFGTSPRATIWAALRDIFEDLSMWSAGGLNAGSIPSQLLWNNGSMTLESVDSYMTNLTGVITAAIRNNGAAGRDEYHRGTVVQVVTCLRVSWLWIIYPAALVAGTVLLLIGLIAYNNLDKNDATASGGWKSSGLPLLFLNVDGELDTQVGCDTDRFGMEAVASAKSVQLIRGEDGRARLV